MFITLSSRYRTPFRTVAYSNKVLSNADKRGDSFTKILKQHNKSRPLKRRKKIYSTKKLHILFFFFFLSGDDTKLLLELYFCLRMSAVKEENLWGRIRLARHELYCHAKAWRNFFTKSLLLLQLLLLS